jgi:hypothetical protein
MIHKTLLCGVIALGATLHPGHAKPPPGADGTLSAWFQSLEDPETTLSCCDEADCRPVEDRIAPAGYEVMLRGIWVAVPEGKVIHGRANPVGRAVLCWSATFGIMCFVPGAQV